MNIRTNHKLRLKAFDLMQIMKKKGLARTEIISTISTKFKIPAGTLYDWHKNKYLPHGRKGKLLYGSELFYVLGALLGDGCLYNWRTTNYYVILVGDARFTKKYAALASSCTGRLIKYYIDRSKNIFFVRTNNYELYILFEKARKNVRFLENLIRQYGSGAGLGFMEGFFDAEGCVKVVKGKERKLPKICLDITNTNFAFLELNRKLLKEHLQIVAKYSVQKPATSNRKIAYHLRIYKKEDVKKFFESIATTKLTKKKLPYLKNWVAHTK